jgi:hypothetical protein
VSQRNISSTQFADVTLHRGIPGAKVTQPLGMHWSAHHGLDTEGWSEKEGATRFLADNANEDIYPGEKGTIIHAKPSTEGITWNKKGDKKLLRESGVFSAYTRKMKEDPYGQYDPEQERAEAEVPVRPGTPVKVEKLTRVRATGGRVKTREIRYKKPRIMEA